MPSVVVVLSTTIVVELVLSGEVERTYRLVRLEGGAAQTLHHSPSPAEVKLWAQYPEAPFVAIFQSSGDVTKENLQPAIAKAAAVSPHSRVSSYFNTRNDVYVSKDRHTTFAEIYPGGENTFNGNKSVKKVRAVLAANAPPGVTTHLTGQQPLFDASSGGGSGPSVFTEALIGGAGALVILLFVFGTLPAVGIPLAIAISSILNTFTLVWVLTYITNVSIIVQYLVARMERSAEAARRVVAALHADVEERHAELWAQRLRDAGRPVPSPRLPAPLSPGCARPGGRPARQGQGAAPQRRRESAGGQISGVGRPASRRSRARRSQHLPLRINS